MTLEVHNSRKLVSVCIHVEQGVCAVRNKFVIMKSVQPINFVACRLMLAAAYAELATLKWVVYKGLQQ